MYTYTYMIHPVFPLFVVLITVIGYSLYYCHKEPFQEGAANDCTAANQSKLQSGVMELLQQPIINTNKMVVEGDAVLNDVKKVVGNGIYKECPQTTELQSIIDKNPQSKFALPALYSYYTTK